ncbi:MAG: dTDP-glucose 4,6-dehydratase, partial [Burkholderiales bacterium]|nr:dTDP-glucose 4,6-dehydratase [Burkholderiales bacterium]
GAGFIGANFVLGWCARHDEPVVNLDALTYAGNVASLAPLAGNPRHVFVRGDIGDADRVAHLFAAHRPRAVVHFAAESHVDRSIHDAAAFIQTNVVGTHTLLECATRHWVDATGRDPAFRFLHVSTDEVYGSLGPDDAAFSETTPYAPNSPYAASKAASDHLVRAWHHTHGLPTLTTHCSNNYGPLQFPEKLIPLMLLNARTGKPLPVYGDGANVRDWLHVSDHCAALRVVLDRGVPGRTWNIGGKAERRNLDLVHALCGILDTMCPDSPHRPHASLITFVTDRPGHDRRYAIDAARIAAELGWTPAVRFEDGLAQTVRWYLDHAAWVDGVTSGRYRDWVDLHYGSTVA